MPTFADLLQLPRSDAGRLDRAALHALASPVPTDLLEQVFNVTPTCVRCHCENVAPTRSHVMAYVGG